MALHEFIQSNRGQIIECCRVKAASRRLTPLTGPAMEHGVPLFLDQLSSALRLGVATTPDISLSASRHGHDLLHQGYSLSQVVHDYGDVCQAITALAVDAGAAISTDDFRVLNRCLDDAIAGAVTEYGRERNESEVEGESARGNERLGFFAHEMRNLINTAIVAFEVLKTGNVGVAGSTGTVLQRSLTASRALIGRSLAEIRLTQGITSREQFSVSELLAEIAAAAQLDAQSRGVPLDLASIASDVVIEGDRQVLTSVVGNLVQNGLKFTRPGTLVALKAYATPDRVCIEIEDRCGGLPSENVHELFRPFEQRGGDRTGVGLGLAFSRWGAEANGGQVYARSLPGIGCVFTVDLPRLTLPTGSAVPA